MNSRTGGTSLVATLFSFIPTSFFLQIDEPSKIVTHHGETTTALIIAAVISVCANLAIKVGDRALHYLKGYRIADWIFSKFKCQKVTRTEFKP